MNEGYLNPDFVLLTPAVGGPLTPMVDPVLISPSAVPTASLLPLLTDTTSTITTAATDSVTDSVSGKMAASSQVLALAARFPGVTIHPDGQALPVPAAATPAAQPFTATTLATIQQPGSATTVTTAASTSTAATFVVLTALSESTASSAVATTSATTDVAFNVLPMSTATTSAVVAPLPLITSTVVSSSGDTGVAVSVSSGSNPPGSTYVTSTQFVTLPVIVVYSQDILKRYDGSTSPKEFMEHFDIIADVNGLRTKLDKLKHLKAALDGRAACQIKDLDESDLAKAFAALRGRLLNHFGFSNEAETARRRFGCRSQLEGEAIDKYADALLKLSRAARLT